MAIVRLQVTCGDSWGNSSLILGTSDGVMLLTPHRREHTREPILLFDRSIGVVVQLRVMESYGILVFRAERNRPSTDGSSAAK